MHEKGCVFTCKYVLECGCVCVRECVCRSANERDRESERERVRQGGVSEREREILTQEKI